MALTKSSTFSVRDILNEVFNQGTGKLGTEGAGGSSGTQYSDGTSAAIPTGTAVNWNDAGTQRTASAAKPLPVSTAPLTSALDTVTVVQDSNSTAALSQVSSLTSSQVILAANTNRKEAVIYNNSTANLYLAFTGTASTTAFTVKLATNTAYALPMPLYKGVISGIWDAASGSAQVTEY